MSKKKKKKKRSSAALVHSIAQSYVNTFHTSRSPVIATNTVLLFLLTTSNKQNSTHTHSLSLSCAHTTTIVAERHREPHYCFLLRFQTSVLLNTRCDVSLSLHLPHKNSCAVLFLEQWCWGFRLQTPYRWFVAHIVGEETHCQSIVVNIFMLHNFSLDYCFLGEPSLSVGCSHYLRNSVFGEMLSSLASLWCGGGGGHIHDHQLLVLTRRLHNRILFLRNDPL